MDSKTNEWDPCVDEIDGGHLFDCNFLFKTIVVAVVISTVTMTTSSYDQRVVAQHQNYKLNFQYNRSYSLFTLYRARQQKEERNRSDSDLVRAIVPGLPTPTC